MSERHDLKHYEDVIRRASVAIQQAGEALAKVREMRLYRESHTTFEAYCHEVLGITYRYVNYMIEAAGVIENLGTNCSQMPVSIGQTRAIAKAPPHEQAEVWQVSCERAGGEAAPARIVTEVIADRAAAIDTPQEVIDALFDGFGPLQRERGTAPDPEPGYRGPVAAKKKESHNEWFTPSRYVDAGRRVLGAIDLDPASCARANETVRADHYFTIETNGLNKLWPGRVWLNPPYGRDEEGGSGALRWVNHMIAQYRDGIATAAIICVNSLTYAPWFRPLYDFPICFVNHRVKFECGVPREEPERPSNGTAFIYLGADVDAFIREFSEFGAVVQRLEVMV
jgi:hypothetical protein